MYAFEILRILKTPCAVACVVMVEKITKIGEDLLVFIENGNNEYSAIIGTCSFPQDLNKK